MSRVFANERILDRETMKWLDVFAIDGVNVDFDTYLLESEYEMTDQQPQPQPEFTDEDIQDIAFVEKFASLIENSECQCGSHLRNALYELLCTAKEIGYAEAYEEIEHDCDECESDQNVVNIHIESLNIGSNVNAEDFIEQLKNLTRISTV